MCACVCACVQNLAAAAGAINDQYDDVAADAVVSDDEQKDIPAAEEDEPDNEDEEDPYELYRRHHVHDDDGDENVYIPFSSGNVCVCNFVYAMWRASAARSIIAK